ncbi:ABC transporter ATP-binding protein [Cytobacillus sp. FSL W7-1323]|uniref:ABC transporter ATP-binding protein n=2 Tax=Cytobacillus TaxID=2675230 RepID=A0A248TE74_9BACI|nr:MULTISPECIES: ABC transporter ATP-binding protein [Cytobacillus]ASV66466.1 ABC transporter ATP-binding protein [Cytobacillus kochii]MBD7938601.1 ABC transporter ATP-binding protein [Cytobacillus stercorigallinarum]MDQ0187138.1 acetoin utilization transport system ATP-binding protein [Cytobacillus kochii]MEA1854414.1 ABC transporter ATP-binding protein [Cytobacillus sp. OWB-43]
MIEVNKIYHSFEIGKKEKKTVIPVLKDVSFQINKGEIVSIVGKSGSGKSTLLNIISGFIKPTDGEVKINNQTVTELSEGEFASFRLQHIGFIFQNFQLIPSMTAFQNVELPLTFKGMNEKERKQKTLETLERVGLAEFKDHYPSELSGGQQQRVSIARALVVNPPLILADEPTGSLDSDTEKSLLAFIKQLNEELGITFLIITHDEEVAEFGHRTIEIVDGHVLEEVGK